MFIYLKIISVFPVAQTVKNVPAMPETQLRSLGWADPLEKGMAIHSNILAWGVPWTEEPGGLQSMGSKESDTAERLTPPLKVMSGFSSSYFVLWFSCSVVSNFLQPMNCPPLSPEVCTNSRPLSR